MAKKIYFENIKEETVNIINTITDINFGVAVESKNLYVEIKKTKELLETVKSAIAMGETPLFKEVDLEKKIQVLTEKRHNLNKYRKERFFDYKEKNTEVEHKGLFSDLGVTSDLYNAFLACDKEGKFQAYDNCIKTMLEKMGLSVSDKHVIALRKRLYMVVGARLETLSGIRDGRLIRDTKANTYVETFAMKLIDEIKETCKNVCVPSEKLYTAKVEYNAENNILKIEVVEKEEEPEKEETK